MEQNSTFVALPIEIHYKYVHYIDLRDLASLMFTCKEFYEQFGTDLQLQKIVYEHTEQRVLHNKLRRPIKQLFMENRAFYAVKIDDTEFLKYTLPSLSYKDIAVKLRPFSSDPKILLVTKSSKKKKLVVNDKNLLQKIFDNDAAKCLDFLLKAFESDVLAKITETQDQETEIFTALLLIAIVCFKPLQLLGSPSKLPYQKVLRVFLQHCHKWKELILATLVVNINIESPHEATLYSKMVFESLMACSKEFPEFHIDLGMRIPARLLPLTGYSTHRYVVETLLEYIAAAPHDNKINGQYVEGGTFKYLMDHGAPFDPEAPYLPLTFKVSPFSPLSLYLKKLNANISALLKPANETILNSYLSHPWHVIGRKRSSIEYALYRGAKLTKEEETRWLSTAPDSLQYKAAVCQQTSGYNPLKTIGEIPDFSGGHYQFSSVSAEIHLHSGRRFDDFGNMSSGVWEQQDGKLILQDTHKKISFGSYDEDAIIEGDAPPIRIYAIVKTLDGVALADVDPDVPEDTKIIRMLFGVFKEHEFI